MYRLIKSIGSNDSFPDFQRPVLPIKNVFFFVYVYKIAYEISRYDCSIFRGNLGMDPFNLADFSMGLESSKEFLQPKTTSQLEFNSLTLFSLWTRAKEFLQPKMISQLKSSTLFTLISLDFSKIWKHKQKQRRLAKLPSHDH
jgi:hypothetical protein